MQAKASKKPIVSIVILVVSAAGLVLSGCHAGHKATVTESDEICPVCQTDVRVMPLTDLTYTICVCPGCKEVSTLDAATREAVEAYTGGSIGNTVHVCDKCGTLIERCAACRERADQ